MNHLIDYAQCPCCGNGRIAKVLEAADHTVSHEIFSIWECAACTLRFTQSVPDAASIGRYYQSSEYVSHSDTRKGLINTMYHLVRGYTLSGKKNLVTGVVQKKKGALLDVGAGTGAFAKTMQSAGWKVTGLEPDPTARGNALRQHALELHDPAQLYTLPPESFDAITLWHVLEHVHDLHGYFDQFHRLLKKEGKLLIAVPNYTSYDAQVYGASWAAYDVPRHLYHFSPESMRQLADSKGFVIGAYKGMWFDSFYVSLLSEQYKNGKPDFAAGMLTGLRSNLKAAGNPQKCSSVIYVLFRK